VQVPTARSFSVSAQARLSPYIADDEVDRLLGIPDASEGAVTATSSERLPGSLERRAHAAVDGDPTTHWSSPFTQQVGQSLTIEVAEPTTFDQLDLQVVADGRHSVPTRMLLVVDGDEAAPVPLVLPPIDDGAAEDHVVAVPVQLPGTVTGTTFSFVFDELRQVQTTDWYSNDPVNMPVGIAEIGIPGVRAAPAAERFDSGCRDDLLAIDGEPVPLQVTGSTVDALRRQRLDVTPCGAGAGSAVDLAAGEHVLRSGIGRDLGIDIDRVALTSAPGGAALTGPEATDAEPTLGPPITRVDEGRVSYEVEVDATGEPFWLAVGQSWSDGWRATVDGDDLGAPQVVDGFANGWLVEPTGTDPVRIAVEWAPQRAVWGALAASLLAVAVCLWLVVRDRRRPPGPGQAAAQGAVLALPWEDPDERVPRRTAVVCAVLLGVFTFLNVPFAGFQPVGAAVVVAAATYGLFRWPRGRSWLALAGAGCLALAATYIVTGQLRHGHESDFTWPLQYTRVHLLGLLAVILLLADGLRGWLTPSAGPTDDRGEGPAPAPGPASPSI
jgi:arabinofuranan 3-O-arabinosyltransferase